MHSAGFDRSTKNGWILHVSPGLCSVDNQALGSQTASPTNPFGIDSDVDLQVLGGTTPLPVGVRVPGCVVMSCKLKHGRALKHRHSHVFSILIDENNTKKKTLIFDSQKN